MPAVAMAERLHDKGLLFGLYSDRGFRTCQGLPGLLDFEELDAQTMASWGIDVRQSSRVADDVCASPQ